MRTRRCATYQRSTAGPERDRYDAVAREVEMHRPSPIRRRSKALNRLGSVDRRALLVLCAVDGRAVPAADVVALVHTLRRVLALSERAQDRVGRDRRRSNTTSTASVWPVEPLLTSAYLGFGVEPTAVA